MLTRVIASSCRDGWHAPRSIRLFDCQLNPLLRAENWAEDQAFCVESWRQHRIQGHGVGREKSIKYCADQLADEITIAFHAVKRRFAELEKVFHATAVLNLVAMYVCILIDFTT